MKWDHDTPRAERHLMKILEELTTLRPKMDCGAIYAFGEPESFKYPIAYVSEPGFWTMDQTELTGIREYVAKGGFLIFDDFEEDQWYNMAEQLAQALPEGQWVEIDETHPIFDTFFYVENIYVPHPLVRVTPSYRVIFEGNDPEKRIMVLANHNSDLAEYWEYAAQGYFAVDPTNDAFRLGINYIVYGLTH